MTSFTMSVKDERGGKNAHTTLGELSWEKLWEALGFYDGNRHRRDGKKFYVFSSRVKPDVSTEQVFISTSPILRPSTGSGRTGWATLAEEPRLNRKRAHYVCERGGESPLTYGMPAGLRG